MAKSNSPKKYWYLDPEKKRILAHDTNTSYQNVWKALSLKSNSSLAVKIRAMAKNRGAVLYESELNKEVTSV